MTYPNTAGYAQIDTSRNAATAIDEKAEALRKECLDLFDSGWKGTDFELAKKLNQPYETIQPRRSELAKQGKVMDTGERSNLSRSGRTAAIWARNNAPVSQTAPDLDNPTQEKKTHTDPVKINPSVYSKSDEALYWKMKAGDYARVLGKISVMPDAGSRAIDLAKRVLGS